MAVTPEGKVKTEVKKVLAKFGDLVDGFWPVPSGYGESHLDYVGCCNGVFFCIETKAPGKKLAPRQIERKRRVQNAKGKVFVIDGTDKTDTYADLERWLNTALTHRHPFFAGSPVTEQLITYDR